MIAVADTSPLNYLVLIDEIYLLPILFGKVVVPTAVFQELQNARSPLKLRKWAINHPTWLEVRAVNSLPAPQLMGLDAGEREAIQLALELGINTLLINEADGRMQAERFQLQVRGTLSVLERGSKLGKTDFRWALNKLQQTNFRLSPSLREAFLKRNA